MPPKSTVSILGTVVVYSGIPQMQGLPSQFWGFNPLLLRLLREISLSLLCLHRSWGSALVLVPPLHVGCPQASVPPPQTGVGQSSGCLGVSCSLRVGIRRGTVVITACRECLKRQRPACSCNSLRRVVCSPREVGPGSWDPGNGMLHRFPGGCG